MFFKKNRKKEIIIILLLLIGFLIPLVGLFSASLCSAQSINECLLKTSNLFSDFYIQYNTMVYIANQGVILPFSIEIPENGIWVQKQNYHAPLYFYFGAVLYLISKKINISDLFLIYFFTTLFILFANIIFFLNIKKISKWIYGKYNKNFVIYALILFLFLPTELQASIGLKDDAPAFFLYMLAIFYYLKMLENKKNKYTIYLGITLGVGLLTRIDTVIIMGGFAFQMIFFHFKKEKKIRNHIFSSLALSSIIGSGTFIKNIILYNNPLGYITSEASRGHLHQAFKVVKVFTAYWGGIFGGNEYIKPILIIFILILCFLIILGLIIYFKKYSNFASNIFLMIGFFTLIFMFFFTCSISNLLIHGVCKGDVPQGRHFSSLSPLIAILTSISLIKIKSLIKNNKLKVLPDIFLIILSLLFIIDFLSVFIHI